MNRLRTAIALSLIPLVAGCGGSNFRPEQAAAVSVADTIPTPSFEDTLASAREYRLGPLDKVSVRVFGAPDLATTAQIDAAGNFSMPLAGDVPATGLTPRGLSDAIGDRLRGRYLVNPDVTVSLDEAVSQRVTVDGAVRAPGQYPLVSRTTLIEVIAMAQGPGEYANTGEVVVFRTVQGQRYAARFDLNDIRGGRAADPEVFGNDTVVVGRDRVRMLIRDLGIVAPLAGFFYLLR